MSIPNSAFASTPRRRASAKRAHQESVQPWLDHAAAHPNVPRMVLRLMEHMAEWGPGRWHDPEANTHGVTRAFLAARMNRSEKAIQYAIRAAVEHGYLARHSPGQTRQQAVYHFTLPGVPVPCLCSGFQGEENYGVSGGRNAPESSPLVVTSTGPVDPGVSAVTGAGQEEAATDLIPLLPVSTVPQHPGDGTTVVKGPRLETEPPVGDYTSLPVVLYVITRLARLNQEKLMAAEAFHNDTPLDLGITELAWPKEATDQGCREAWHKGYQETHRDRPDPTYAKRAMNKVTNLAKDRTDLDTWRNLWRAARDAGRAGAWNVDAYLAPPPASRYQTRGNKFLNVMEDDATAMLRMLDGHRELGS